MDKSYRELQKAYKDYIQLLGEDLDRHATLSAIHGVVTPPEIVKRGNELRKIITTLEKVVDNHIIRAKKCECTHKLPTTKGKSKNG